MKAIPLFGSGINSYSPVVSRQRRVNCFFDIRKDGDKAQVIVRGTPGSALEFTLPTYPVRGWLVSGNLLYVVAGAVFYSVNAAHTVTVLGLMTNSNSACALADNGVQVLIVDGTQGWVYTYVTGSYYQSALNAAGAFGKLTADPNFPAGASSAAFIDGYGVVNRPASRQAYVSGLYDFTSWTNASSLPTYFTKENASDLLQAVDVLNGAVILWGSQTMEFWQDVGAFPLPFQRINGATQTWGLAAVRSRALLNNTMVFLGQNPQGTLQVMMLNGYAPTRISTSDIENIISNFSIWQDATSYTYIEDGHPMYQINFPSANRSFLYDALTDTWQEVQTGLALTARHLGNLGIAFAAENYIADSTTGNVYRLRSDAYTDNGVPIKRLVASRHIHADGDVLKIAELWLDMETGVGNQAGNGTTPQVMMRVSKDGGRTFPIERWSALGAVGQYLSPRVLWRRLGAARDFVFEFVMTDPVKFTIIKGSAKPDSEPGQ